MEYLILALVILIIGYLGYQEYKKKTVKPQGYCPKCGEPLMEIGEYCPKCGCKLKDEPKVENPVTELKTEDTGTQFFIDQDEQITQNLEVDKPVLEMEIDVNSLKSEIEISTFPCLIGRLMGECGILIDEPAVGRRHASIEYNNSAFWITDLKSHNGVYINGMKIESQKKTQINHGDIIKIGRATITIL